MNDFMTTVMMTVGVAGLTAPLVPLARTLGVNALFWFHRHMKGKPKFRAGTEFTSLAAPSGVRYGACHIERVDFGFVYVRLQGGGILPIKKIRFKEYQAELKDEDADTTQMEGAA